MNLPNNRITCLLSSVLLIAGLKTGNAEQLYFAAGTSIIPYETSTAIQGKPVSITGLQYIRSIDFRPSDRRLFALGARIGDGLPAVFSVDLSTGLARVVGEPFEAYSESGTWDLAFNPSNDQLRIVSSSGANLVFDTVSGKVLMSFPSSDLLGIGYGGGPTPTLYGLKGSSLVIVNDVDGSLSPVGDTGRVPLPFWGFGFGVSRKTGKAYGYYDTPFGQVSGELYEIDLKTAKTRLLRSSALFIPSLAVAPSQDDPVSGIYRINGGSFRACCGLIGPFETPIPNEEQQFIALSVLPGGGLATMTILGEDEETVFSLPGGGLRPDFRYHFSGGVVSSHSIRFSSPEPSPNPNQASYSFVVNFTEEGLSIQGDARVPCLFCADFPEDFSHSNVVATLVTEAPQIESVWRVGDDLKFTFNGQAGYNYFVEFAPSLPPTQWLSLTNFGVKLVTIEAEISDAVTNAPMRTYRIRKLPCFCR